MSEKENGYMDIRIEKTEKAIRNAFLELRAAKPLEKITVRELCSLACINKSTFYSHYEDIYALSQTLESETITAVLTNISRQQEAPFKDPDVFTRNLYIALVSNHSLISILFSGTAMVPHRNVVTMPSTKWPTSFRTYVPSTKTMMPMRQKSRDS